MLLIWRECFKQCNEIEYINISNFNTSNVTDMFCMFNKCHKLKEIKDIDKLNTSNVTNMRIIFQGCYEIE